MAQEKASDGVCHSLEFRGAGSVSLEPTFVSHVNRGMIALVTIGAAAMAVAVAWYYTVERAQTVANVAQELAAITDAQIKQIATWRRERTGDGRVLMSNPVTNAALRVLDGKPTATDRADLEDIATRLSRAFLYSSASLMDLDGKAHLLGPSSMEAGAVRKLIQEAVAKGDVAMSDLAPEPDVAHPMMHLAIPVRGRGALILDIDPHRFLYPYLEAWPGNSATAETFLVRREGNELVYLSRRRNLPNAPLFARRAVEHTDRPAAVQDAGWQLSKPDYRGVPAFGTARSIPDSPWYLVCKIDLAEALNPVKRLEWEVTLAMSLIVLAACAAAALLWRNQRTAMLLQREAWFRAVINDTPAYLWMDSSEGRAAFINLPLARFLGVKGQPPSDYWSTHVHPEDKDRVREAFQRTLSARGEFIADYRLRRGDGEYRWVCDRGLPRYAGNGQFLGYAGALEDITEQHTAEQQLRDANTALAGELAERTRAEGEVHRLSARLIGAQEEERKRLARELHDDLNQQIAALSIAMGNLKRGIPETETAARAQSTRIFDNLVRLSEGVRRVSHQLHPAALQYSGLAAALREYCGEFQSLTGIRVTARIEGTFDGVTAEQALTVYRIAQEALQNVAKHAHAKDAAVDLTLDGGVLRLKVSDEGVGFDPAAAGESSGLGLVSMKERARLVNGRLRVERGASGGATVTLEIPAGATKAASPIGETAVH